MAELVKVVVDAMGGDLRTGGTCKSSCRKQLKERKDILVILPVRKK